jgi:hypothetical protein
MATIRLHALVYEREQPVHFATLSEEEIEEEGELGLEMRAKEWCDKHRYTFIDLAT